MLVNSICNKLFWILTGFCHMCSHVRYRVPDFIVSFLASQIANVNFNNFPTKMSILELRKGNYLCRGTLFVCRWLKNEGNLLLKSKLLFVVTPSCLVVWKFSLRTEVQICGYYSRKNNDVAQKWKGKIAICLLWPSVTLLCFPERFWNV